MVSKVRRSGLMMPINNPRFVNRSWERNSDSLDYDLEDSVPQSQKEYARTCVKEAIQTGLSGGADISIRINCVSVEADLEASVWPGLSRVMHPKTEDPSQIKHVGEEITRLERERGIRPNTVDVTAMIETARGVTRAYEIASSSTRISAFGGAGGYDMALDLGVEMFVGIDQFVYGNGECELVARALGLQPSINVYTSDTSGSVADAEAAYARAVANLKAGGRSGFGLHPNVVEPNNRGYTPSPEEVEDARDIVAFFDDVDSRGEVEGVLNGRAVDKYEASSARGLIEWAEACALKDAHKSRMQAER